VDYDEFEELPRRETAWQVRDRIAAYRKQLLLCGYRPLPVNGKAPPIPGWQDILATSIIINKWTDQYPDATNTGILTRDTPAIDIDVTDEEVAEKIEVLAEEMLGKSAVRIGRAPKRAILFRTDVPFPKLSTIFISPNGHGHRVEILGLGQQIVVNGTHPDTRRPYTWHGGEPGPALQRKDLPLLSADKAAEFIAAAAELMSNRGWMPAERNKTNGNANGARHAPDPRTVSDRERLYARAALDGCAGELAQAATGERNEMLYKKAFRLGTMVGAGWISRDEVFDALFAAAADCCLNADDGEAQTRKTIESGLDSGEQVPHPDLEGEPKEEWAETTGGDKSKKWPELKPLPDGLPPVESFSSAFLPSSLAPWVDDIANRMQCPPEYVAIPALIALGTLIGRRIGMKPQSKTDWIEVPNFWGFIVGRPGLLKTPAMNEALRPVRALESTASQAHEEKIVTYNAEKRLFELKKQAGESLVKQALKKGGKYDLDLGDEPEEPPAKRYLTNDTSYEQLGEILVANPRGVLVVRDELVSLLRALDRDDQAAARGFYLSAWNGTQPYTFDRINRGHRHIDGACISLLGTTQPGRIGEYVRRVHAAGNADDGLLQRFSLMVWPNEPSTWKDVDVHPDSEARKTARELFAKFDTTEPELWRTHQDEFDRIPFLRFDETAIGVFREWRTDLETRLRSGDLSPALEGHFAKYRKLVPTLALINSLADGAGPVGEKAILRACAFATFLESHARRIYGASGLNERSAAKAILAKIRNGNLKAPFSVRDIHQRDWSGLTVHEHVQAGLGLLVDLDHLAIEPTTSPKLERGRPTTRYLVNPRTLR
jgi:hypothetical protein